MGWNTVAPPPGSRLFSGVPADARFYFVHSYAATPVAGQGLQTLTVHGAPFLAAVERGCVWATQFHPEKSGDLGAKLLRNWLATVE
jgi:glutamine amidotransferase